MPILQITLDISKEAYAAIITAHSPGWTDKSPLSQDDTAVANIVAYIVETEQAHRVNKVADTIKATLDQAQRDALADPVAVEIGKLSTSKGDVITTP